MLNEVVEKWSWRENTTECYKICQSQENITQWGHPRSAAVYLIFSGVIKPGKVGFVGQPDGYGENVMVQSANRWEQRADKKLKGKRLWEDGRDLGHFMDRERWLLAAGAAAVVVAEVVVVVVVVVVRGVERDFEGNVMGKSEVHRKFFVHECKRQI